MDKELNGTKYRECTLYYKYFPMEENLIELNDNNFYKSNNKYLPNCKKCSKAKTLEWNKNNKEKRNSAVKKYAKTKSGLDKQRDKARNWRNNGKRNEWECNNKDKLKEYAIKRKKKVHHITDSEWEECLDYFDNSCAYCGLHEADHHRIVKGVKRQETLHREHVNPNGSNKIDNCVPACNTCNSSKRKKDFHMWYSTNNNGIGGKVYNEGRYNKIISWIKLKSR